MHSSTSMMTHRAPPPRGEPGSACRWPRDARFGARAATHRRPLGSRHTDPVSGTELGLALSVLLASSVEAVEALTIVLAVGTTRGWRSSLYGVAAAVAVLAAVIGALGPALTSL